MWGEFFVLCTILTSCRVIYVVVVPLKKGRGPIRHIKSPDELDLEEVNIPFFLQVFVLVSQTQWSQSHGKCSHMSIVGMFPRGLSGRGDNYTALIPTRWQTATLGHLTLSCGWPKGAYILFIYYFIQCDFQINGFLFVFFKVDMPFCLSSVHKHCLLVLLESKNVDLVFDMVDMLCFKCWFQFFSSSLFSHSCWATEDSVSSSRWTGSGPTSLPASSPHPCRRPSPWVTRECTVALKTGLWTLGRNMCSSS